MFSLTIPTVLLALGTLIAANPFPTPDESRLVPRRTLQDAASICAAKPNNGYQYNLTRIDSRLDRNKEAIIAGAPGFQSAAGCCQACESFDGCVWYAWYYDSWNSQNFCKLMMSNNPSSKGPTQNPEHCPNGIFAVQVPYETKNGVGSPIVPANPNIGTSCAYIVSGGPPNWDGYKTASQQ